MLRPSPEKDGLLKAPWKLSSCQSHWMRSISFCDSTCSPFRCTASWAARHWTDLHGWLNRAVDTALYIQPKEGRWGASLAAGIKSCLGRPPSVWGSGLLRPLPADSWHLYVCRGWSHPILLACCVDSALGPYSPGAETGDLVLLFTVTWNQELPVNRASANHWLFPFPLSFKEFG